MNRPESCWSNWAPRWRSLSVSRRPPPPSNRGMTQNIYDDPEFFAGYSQLLRSREGLDGMPEWAALKVMLPDLEGLRVVDLGCGFGWFCRWAREAGAAEVLGLEVSEKMLARAREMTS